jgi:hypothetical protein
MARPAMGQLEWFRFFQHVARDDEPLHLRGAFANFAEPGVRADNVRSGGPGCSRNRRRGLCYPELLLAPSNGST